MEELKQIDKSLSRITEELDFMWRDVSEHIGSSEGNSVADLGSAINLLNDIRDRIYKQEPLLKPRKWNRNQTRP